MVSGAFPVVPLVTTGTLSLLIALLFETGSRIGEWATGIGAVGSKNQPEIVREHVFPFSPSILSSVFTYILEFRDESDDHIGSERASRGNPDLTDLVLDKLVINKADETFQLSMDRHKGVA